MNDPFGETMISEVKFVPTKPSGSVDISSTSSREPVAGLYRMNASVDDSSFSR